MTEGRRQKDKVLRKTRKENGLCVSCGKPAGVKKNGKHYALCLKCWEDQMQWALKRPMPEEKSQLDEED